MRTHLDKNFGKPVIDLLKQAKIATEAFYYASF